jgi:uncharacterized protein (DUF1800 family)
MNTIKTLSVLNNKFCQHFLNANTTPLLVITFIVLLPTVCVALDSDGDGIDNTQDNCTEIANPNQRDSNGDGFGNLCDADLDNNNSVSFADLDLFRSAFGTNDADADFDGTGSVSFADLDIFRALFGKPPGPAGGGNISEAEAARFLTQTTFGPTFEGIQQLVALGSYETWLNEQFALPITLQLPQARVLSTQMCLDGDTRPDSTITGFARPAAWWNTVVEGDDQLRQRVAFALSQIMVISGKAPGVGGFQFGMANYYDILLRNAFGNFRELLEEVTLNPMMGVYLSHIMNRKADPENNTFPDENYAREILQLFSIGVHELKQNGVLKLDVEDNPIPSYGQNEIKAFARVFTGWVYHGYGNEYQPGAVLNPMVPVEDDHDTDEKILLDHVLPGGQDARTDLENALDDIFDHPNVGPFISKQLIQRLVTSNPSPAYVQRVASAFNNNGQGIRGDLKATIAAILLDPEARTRQADATHSGKLREPLLRLTHLWRSFGANKIQFSENADIGCPGPYIYGNGGRPYDAGGLGFAQEILGAPSVFNFFLPSFAPQGAVSNAGLVAPEFQIFTENTTLSTTTRLNIQVWSERQDLSKNSVLELNDEKIWAENPEQMLDKLNLILMNGEMSTELRGIIMAHLNTAPFPINEDKNLRAKLEDAIVLIINSPDYLIQK